MKTLEKAASTSIYFETLYHALLRSSTSHENHHLARSQRRAALEREMDARGLGEAEKEEERRRLGGRETEGLRDRRRKVGVREFERLNIIGHGQSLSLS